MKKGHLSLLKSPHLFHILSSRLVELIQVAVPCNKNLMVDYLTDMAMP
ncbi:hypothetical protein ACWF7H_27420 [Peribacillus butanolivorans]